MKKVLYTMLMFAGIASFSACSNGDYVANPSDNTNNGINPLNPLTDAEFTWSGETPLSADINGSHWKADEARWGLDTTGANIIVATKGNRMMYFRLIDVWSGNVYDMQYNSKRFSYYVDSIGYAPGYYQSQLGNSGEIKIVQNDSNYIVGQFYYKGVNVNGKAASITNGYFKISKH